MTSGRILYVQYTDPAGYPPLEHSSILLAKQGWDIVFLGTGTAGKQRLEFPARSRVRVQRMRFVEAGWRQKLQYLFFSVWIIYWTWRWRPKWIYASDPLVSPVVWWVRKLFGTCVLYHEHDSPNSHEAHTRFMQKVLSYRRKLARECELCVLPQKLRLQKLLEDTGRAKPTFCVWNCPGLYELTGINPHQERNKSEQQELIVYYHGSITGGRLPTELIAAASRLKGAVRLRVAGRETLGSIGYIAELKALAAKCGTPDIIEFLGTMPLRQDLFRSASMAHVGLSMMPKVSQDINMQQMLGASNKPFDYMACGLPLIVTDMPDWVAAFVNPGYALACDPDDADSIEVALRWYLEHPNERQQMGRKCRDKIVQDWNYETMFADVMTKLGKCQSGPRCSSKPLETGLSGSRELGPQSGSL
jgi:glycosyltransferase involved in cell wall biosynthesis